MQKPIYFDYAAATPVRPEVMEAMAPYWQERFYNPSSPYQAGRQVRLDLDAARSRVAKVLGAKPTEIIFTAGGSEANNLAILGLLGRYPHQKFLALQTEHKTISACLAAVENAGGQSELVPVTVGGQVNLDQLRQAIDDNTVLVSCAYANSEIGAIQPLAQIAGLIQAVRTGRQRRGNNLPLYLHSDAAAAGLLSVSVSRLGVDLLSLNAGKIYGPKYSGGLYVRTGVALSPLIYGGGQERGLRSGTENAAAAVGLATALELVQQERKAESQRLSELSQYLWDQLQIKVDGITLNGSWDKRLPGNLNFWVEGICGETAVHHLDREGVMVATGSACSAGNESPAAALLAIGLTPEQANASLRLTLGRHTTRHDIGRFLEIFPPLVERLRQI
jgi:cysteine desulfurase